MKTRDIAALPVPGVMADNSHLYLWVTNNFMEDGYAVCRAWGFRPVTLITWAKDRMGLGQYFRGQTEHCIFAVRGVLPYKSLDGKRAQGTTLLTAPRTAHSRKPEEMRSRIERVSYGPMLEMFARPQSLLDVPPDWTLLGHGVNGEDIAEELRSLALSDFALPAPGGDVGVPGAPGSPAPTPGDSKPGDPKPDDDGDELPKEDDEDND